MNLRAIILVGGFGTRLRPLTLRTPKALLPVLNKPFITYQLDLLKSAGVKEVVFASGHLSETLKRDIPRKSYRRLKMKFAKEKSPLGTGGAIRFGFDHLSKQNGPIVIFNGDVFLDLDLKRFLNFHMSKKAICSVALTHVPDGTRFGVVRTTPNGRITKFLEKKKKIRGSQWINAGAYIFDSSLFQKIPKGKACSIEKQSFPMFLDEDLSLFGYKFSGYWNDIGTPQTYLQAHLDLVRRKNRWTHTGLFRKRDVFMGRNVKKGKNTLICKSIIMDNVKIGKNVVINSAIIGQNCRIDDNSIVSPGAVIGNNTHITAHTKI